MVMRNDLASAMNARTLGSGDQTIVLAHGYGGDQSFWDKVLPPLAVNHRVLVFDWCFSGAIHDATLYDAGRHGTLEGFAEDLIGLLEEMKIGPSIFVGHSMSGMIGFIASIKRPDLFTRFVLVGASPRFINSEDYEGGFEMCEIENIFWSIKSDFEEWTSKFPTLVVDASDGASVEKLRKSLKRMKPEVALGVAKTVFLGDNREILDKIEKPCDVIQTRRDAVVPNSVPEYIKTKVKGIAKVHILDTTDGHFPMLTAHAHFVKLLLDHILAAAP